MAPKQKMPINSHNTIPQDLCFAEILPRLPAKSLIRFESVSKEWNSLISSPDFANLHLKLCKHTNLLIESGIGLGNSPYRLFNLKVTRNNSKLSALINNHHKREIRHAFHGNIHPLGSCHGLICYYNGTGFFISNPTVQKLCSIPQNPDWDQSKQLAGFGYDSSTEDYKIVVLSRGEDCYYGNLIALKNRTWKKLDMSWCTTDEDDLLTYGMPKDMPYPIQIEDTLHWLLKDHNPKTFTVLLTFDLAKEVFSVIDLTSEDDNTIGITQIRGSLCKVHHQSGSRKLERKPPRVEVQMLEKHGVWDSWKTLYVCNLGMETSKDHLHLFEFRDENNDDRICILKHIGSRRLGQSKLRLYYIGSKSLRQYYIGSESLRHHSKVVIEEFSEGRPYFSFRTAYSFTESLIWPAYFPRHDVMFSIVISTADDKGVQI